MKFKYGTRRAPIEYEKDLVKYWKDHKVFEKSVEFRSKSDAFVFYDGPPFITGVPHHGTLLSSIVKDAVPRYWTMKGKRVERVWGWDCHGLPAEVFTERKLGIKDKREIGTKISLEEYILSCRENMVATGSLWEDTIDRVGRWVDFRGAYKTMDKEYMESVWWAFKTLCDKGKIYEGEKVLLYCTRDATPLAKAEVAMDNSYQDVTDPSVYVRFKLLDDRTKDNSPDSTKYLLAWTTTPWTLHANTAIAVNKDIEYAEVECEQQVFILAKDLIEKALTDEKHNVIPHNIIRTYKGSELIGKSYEPLFETKDLDNNHNAFRIWHADFVHAEEGTGIAHEAPAYGEDDYTMAKQNGIPMVLDTDDEGFYTDGPWKGKQVWEVNKEIAKELHEKSIVWKIDYIRHSYPHCHRCGTKLMYRAHPSWFMDIEGQRQQMLEQNGSIEWFPEHIKHGRFENTVTTAPDWNLSRDRFWATAMPVWKGVDKDGKEHVKVIGSYEELKQLSGVELEDYHRPWIDDVTFTLDGVKYQRIDKVMDSWFEAGSMPFAQFHYPFENVEKFEQNFPGDFIAEYVGQVRAWFYYLHAVSVGLFGKNSFKNVIVTGTVAGNDGRKMSKSYGNYTDPNLLMDKYSADALRLLLLSSPLLNGEDYSLLDKDVADVSRKLSMVWNMYDFFTMYAEVDGWSYDADKHDAGLPADPSPDTTNPLDHWIITRMHQTLSEIDKHMLLYDVPNATKQILPFIEDASNWYVRRSRKRFWRSKSDDLTDDKTNNDVDKTMAYRTLHYVLTNLSIAMAPFTPFLSEELFRNLTGDESVHLQDWPKVGHLNEQSLTHMSYIREVINEGLSQRAAAGIKVRQPLQDITIKGAPAFMANIDPEYTNIITEELNVKELIAESAEAPHQVTINTTITKALKAEGLSREVIRQVQTARKAAGLQVDDRIKLILSTDDDQLRKAITEHSELIKHETLALHLSSGGKATHETSVKVDDSELRISLEKA